jgi:methyltransferase (TIGR00027 family)
MARPPTSEGDSDGEARLNADLGAGSSDAPGPLFPYLAARTRFFDDVTVKAVDAGTVQVVIVGAGYDCRALRFRHRGVRFFELDHPATQHDKRERLDRLGVATADVTYVAIDLIEGDVDAALGAAGHDPAPGSLFVCEGLLLYLDVKVIERVLRGLRNRVGQDATLALSVGLNDRVDAPGAVAVGEVATRRAVLHRRLRRLGEPPRTTLRRDEWDALLTATGWVPDLAVDPHALEPEALAGGALFMTADPDGPRR